MALAYRAGGQWTRAVTAYERVSQVSPRLDGEAMLGTAWCYFRAGDDYKARFFAGLAAKAGVDVGPLREALLGPPKAAAAASRSADELYELALQLEEKNAGEQALAAQRLLAIGRSAVPTLASALRDKDTAIAVREQIVDRPREDGTGRSRRAARARPAGQGRPAHGRRRRLARTEGPGNEARRLHAGSGDQDPGEVTPEATTSHSVPGRGCWVLAPGRATSSNLLSYSVWTEYER